MDCRDSNKERKGKERKGKERKGKERKGKERKGGREEVLHFFFSYMLQSCSIFRLNRRKGSQELTQHEQRERK